MQFLNLVYQEHVEYEIVKGNEEKQFEIMTKRGVWSLHFRRRLKEPSAFNLEIRASNDGSEQRVVDESLDFHVRIQVVP